MRWCRMRIILGFAFVMIGCLDGPVPKASPAPTAVPATLDEPAGARAPTLDSSNQPKPADEKRCQTMQSEAADLASRCFRLFPDDAACAAFHEIVAELNKSGCADPDMGQSTGVRDVGVSGP